MLTLQFLLHRLCGDESGQDMIEYVLISAFIALVAITGLNNLSNSLSQITYLFWTQFFNLYNS